MSLTELAEIPFTIKQYVKVITHYYGTYAIRHHLHEEKFYTNPFELVPELNELVKIIPSFKPLHFDPYN